MDAVSEVLIARGDKGDGLSSMLGASAMAHVALVAVFLPLAFQTSATGRLFVEFAVAVAASVVISAFVALTLSPMMSARILRSVDHRHDNFVLRIFERFLNLIPA